MRRVRANGTEPHADRAPALRIWNVPTLKQLWNIPYLLPVALLGAVLPDFDTIWFLFIDQGAIHYNRYWVHIPPFWAMVVLVVLPAMAVGARGYLGTACVFSAALLMHLLLDTVSGGILWGAWFSDHLCSLVTVPAPTIAIGCCPFYCTGALCQNC